MGINKKKPTGIQQEVPNQSTRPTLRPQLLWPSVDLDSGMPWKPKTEYAFPSRTQIEERQKSTNLLPLQEFLEAVIDATERVYILDLHFDDTIGGASLYDAIGITHVKLIRIITGKKESQHSWEEKYNKTRNQYVGSMRPRGLIEWKVTLSKELYPFAHDRFAITDQELWHFGATVGGGHRSLNAASRGWDAKETRALEFFEEIWRELR